MMITLQNNSRSDYVITDVIHGKVFLKDLDRGRMSVTNNAENVYLEVMRAYPDCNRVIYCDTIGLWDEIIMNDDGDVNFKAYVENV